MSNSEIIILAAFIKEKPSPLAYKSSHPMSERNQYTHTPKLTFFFSIMTIKGIYLISDEKSLLWGTLSSFWHSDLHLHV